jgi:hypothetical protein
MGYSALTMRADELMWMESSRYCFLGENLLLLRLPPKGRQRRREVLTLTYVTIDTPRAGLGGLAGPALVFRAFSSSSQTEGCRRHSGYRACRGVGRLGQGNLPPPDNGTRGALARQPSSANKGRWSWRDGLRRGHLHAAQLPPSHGLSLSTALYVDVRALIVRGCVRLHGTCSHSELVMGMVFRPAADLMARLPFQGDGRSTRIGDAAAERLADLALPCWMPAAE